MLERLSEELGHSRARALLAVGVAALATVGGLATLGHAARQVAPANTSPPTVSGTPVVGSELTASPGAWTGTQPIVHSYRWRRCNAAGRNCVDLGGAGAARPSYTVRNADAGFTLRVRVTARNNDGRSSAQSAPTARVVQQTGPAGQIRLPNGEVSIPATSVPLTERLIVDRVDFLPNRITSRATPIQITVKVKDTRNYVVRDVLVFIRSTPLVTSQPPETRTREDGTVTFAVQPEPDFSIRAGYSTQFFVRARKEGDRPLAGVAGYRLVQVASTG